MESAADARKERIYQKIREQGLRLTRQRKVIIEVILENECECCKEIYYKALDKDSDIGVATVYRMIKTLEDIGEINRKNMYRIDS